ncbi:hypothetical protein Tco_1463656, partial [Tanacetum coccineum]
RRQGIRDVGYGIRDTWVDPAEAVPKIAPMTVGEETVWMVEEEAYASREAWAHSIGLSQATHQELQTHRDHAKLAALRETDRRLQAQMVETLRVIIDMRREMSDMQAKLLALGGHQRGARQPGPDARSPDSELASLDVVEIVIPKVRGIDTYIHLTIKDDILYEKLLNVNLLIVKIEALKDNPTPSSDFVTKSSSTSLNFFLEETNTFNNSLPESETFCFNLEEIGSGSPTSYLDLSLPDYEAFFCDSEPNSGNFTMDVVEDIFDNPTREPRVHVPNVLPTFPTHHLDSDFTLCSDSLGSDLVVSFPSETRNKIFDPGIFIKV